jgi:hypothetical protein
MNQTIKLLERPVKSLIGALLRSQELPLKKKLLQRKLRFCPVPALTKLALPEKLDLLFKKTWRR